MGAFQQLYHLCIQWIHIFISMPHKSYQDFYWPKRNWIHFTYFVGSKVEFPSYYCPHLKFLELLHFLIFQGQVHRWSRSIPRRLDISMQFGLRVHHLQLTTQYIQPKFFSREGHNVSICIWGGPMNSITHDVRKWLLVCDLIWSHRQRIIPSGSLDLKSKPKLEHTTNHTARELIQVEASIITHLRPHSQRTNLSWNLKWSTQQITLPENWSKWKPQLNHPSDHIDRDSLQGKPQLSTPQITLLENCSK